MVALMGNPRMALTEAPRKNTYATSKKISNSKNTTFRQMPLKSSSFLNETSSPKTPYFLSRNKIWRFNITKQTKKNLPKFKLLDKICICVLSQHFVFRCSLMYLGCSCNVKSPIEFQSSNLSFTTDDSTVCEQLGSHEPTGGVLEL